MSFELPGLASHLHRFSVAFGIGSKMEYYSAVSGRYTPHIGLHERGAWSKNFGKVMSVFI